MNQQQLTDGTRYSITVYQAFTIVVSTIYGVGVLSLPRDVAEVSGNDMSWIIIVSGIFVGIIIALLTALCMRFPGQTIVQFAPEILGSRRSHWLGRFLTIIVLLIIALYLVSGISMSVRIFGEAMVNAVLVNTPIEAVILVLLISVAIAAGSEFGIVAKYNELLMLLNFLPLVIEIFAFIQRGESTNLLPLLQMNTSQLPKAMLSGAFAYSGYSVLLMFSGFYKQPMKAWKAHLFAIGTIIVLYWIKCVGTLSIFGKDELVRVMYPVLETGKVIRLHAMLFERLESAILSIWLVLVFTSVLNLYACTVQMVIEFFRLKGRYRRWIAFAFAPVLYVMAMAPENMGEVGKYAERVGIFGFLTDCLPILLLVIAILRRKKGEMPREISSSR
ncbi:MULTISPECIES: endospore germination permease [unclassified Thermoactinomyces]|jgi:spore germination protein|uniref:GerAB/ArcD/ProY family transporter n=1 Tax=unclassified Thermoactinomyces TaxID=2634588 RepID=UPI0018DD1C39|nr:MULTISPECIES: endospore germination permease [unclassified Thermoactinomyces]MBH8598119.1 endospore germination permease [Thermoactinomyces sp. CICC 10523]MBH8603150.1 endospore germination permease [Thermoactinomyces sp. CICC 10522]